MKNLKFYEKNLKQAKRKYKLYEFLECTRKALLCCGIPMTISFGTIGINQHSGLDLATYGLTCLYCTAEMIDLYYKNIEGKTNLCKKLKVLEMEKKVWQEMYNDRLNNNDPYLRENEIIDIDEYEEQQISVRKNSLD